MATRMNATTTNLQNRLNKAERGDADAYYDLGIAYSVGRGDVPVDLIEAHKWFNLAAMAGNRRAQEDRAEIASEMSAAEIAEAQRHARAWMSRTHACAA